MKKIILSFLLAIAMASTVSGERTPLHMQTHQSGSQSSNLERERTPISLPISVFYDSDTNILEVWCDNDNIQAEVFVYDESGAEEAYSPYMNVAIPLSSYSHHSILLKGDGWEAEGEF